MAAAREFAAANPDIDLAEEQPTEPTGLPATVAEVEYLDLAGENIAAIVWATGYDYDYDRLQVPVWILKADRFNSVGSPRCPAPLQQRGITQVSGLYFLGLHWMHTFKSGLFSGVGSDAEYLAEHIDPATGRSRRKERPIPAATPPAPRRPAEKHRHCPALNTARVSR